MRIQIAYRDGTQKVWETQGVPAGRESVPTAYGVEWDLFLKHDPYRKKTLDEWKQVGWKTFLVLETTAKSARGESSGSDTSTVSGDAPGQRAAAARKAANMTVKQIEDAERDRERDADVRILVEHEYECEEPERQKLDTVSKLLDSVTDRGGVARMVIDGEVVYPPMDDEMA